MAVSAFHAEGPLAGYKISDRGLLTLSYIDIIKILTTYGIEIQGLFQPDKFLSGLVKGN